LNKMVSTFNRWCMWVPTLVLSCPTAGGRAAILTHFIQITAQCLKLNNFNSAFAIFAGLIHSSISRLKGSWEQVPRKGKKLLAALRDIFSLSNNHTNYRSLLSQLPLPVCPYLGVLMKDLFVIEETISNKWAETDLINFGKLRLLQRVVNQALGFQKVKYEIKSNPEIHDFLIHSITIIDNEVELYNMSLRCEPRHSK